MNSRSIAIAMLVAGVILLIWGFNMYGVFDSRVSRAFSGSPTNKAMWTLIGGGALAIAGAYQLFLKRR